MDMDFVVLCPLVRSEKPLIRFLYIESQIRYRFLQTSPHGDALASRLSFTSIRLDGGLAPPSCRTCSAHEERPARESRAGRYEIQIKQRSLADGLLRRALVQAPTENMLTSSPRGLAAPSRLGIP